MGIPPGRGGPAGICGICGMWGICGATAEGGPGGLGNEAWAIVLPLSFPKLLFFLLFEVTHGLAASSSL